MEEDLFENEIPMYIMSNPIKMNGAATMAYPGVIRNFAETIRKNLYVIPSSIHELIIMPAEDGSLSLSKLSQRSGLTALFMTASTSRLYIRLQRDMSILLTTARRTKNSLS